MRAASSESEWAEAVLQSGRAVSSSPLSDSGALELLASLAALTIPCPAPIAGDAAARRFAKVKVAEIRLYQAPAVESGRAARDVYGALKPHIDAARKAFAERFLQNGNRAADYLHLELVRVLANDDAAAGAGLSGAPGLKRSWPPLPSPPARRTIHWPRSRAPPTRSTPANIPPPSRRSSRLPGNCLSSVIT